MTSSDNENVAELLCGVKSELPLSAAIPPCEADIARRAYQIYEARGHEGSAVDDWLQAERELRETQDKQ